MPWSPTFSIGVAQIDAQHKTLVEQADKLFEASKSSKGKEHVGELLNFLEDYTKKHFADEEKYMLSIGYPGYGEQKAAHTDFIRQIARLRSEYTASGGNLLVILNANQLVVQWLTQHISNMDRKIGQYKKP